MGSKLNRAARRNKQKLALAISSTGHDKVIEKAKQAAARAALDRQKEIQDETSIANMDTFYKVFAVALHQTHGFGDKRIMKVFERVDSLMEDNDFLEHLDEHCAAETGMRIEFNGD